VNLLKNILGRIFAVWGMMMFALTMLIFLAPIGLSVWWPEPKRSHISYFFWNIWLNVFLPLAGIRLVVKGKENFRKGKNYVVICNHNSLFDPPVSAAALPGPHKTIAKVEMARIPLFGIIYRRGAVLVDRNSEESRRTSFLKMKEVLEQGLHMCIYPEGTRNKTSYPIQRFHDGAFRLASDMQKEVIPSLIFNTAKVMPRRPTFFFWPQRVEMHFLPPIAVEGKSVQAIKQEAFKLMESYYVANR
jgi:1-acyl-sn-glycerol-3-phosphate acyltransferase